MAAGEIGAPEIQPGVQSPGQVFDEFPGLGGFRGGGYVLPGEVSQEGDVFVYTVVQQGLILKDNAKPAPEVRPAECGDIPSSQPDHAAAGVVQPEEQGGQCGFSRAGGAQNAQSFPFL